MGDYLCFGLYPSGGRFADLGGVMYNRRKLYAHHKSTGAPIASAYVLVLRLIGRAWCGGLLR